MNAVLKYTLIGLLVVGLVGITAVGIAYAEDDPPRPHEILADLLGLTSDELHEQFQNGRSLEELAEDAGIDLDELKEALQTSRDENFTAHIQEALDNGDITQEQADWLIEGFDKGFMGGGRGVGGRGRMGMFRDQQGEKPEGDWPGCFARPKSGSWDRIPRFNQ